MLTLEQERAIIEELTDFDTPTVTNVVATYPGRPLCLNLYHPWDVNWYTDETLRVMYPNMRPVCGYAATCVMGVPDPTCPGGPVFLDLFKAVKATADPVVVFFKQDFPEHIKHKSALCGGNLAAALKSCGCVGIVSDGPARDIKELEPMGIQYMLTGATAGHGPLALKAINVPVSICGMDVAPGEIIHMDENGAVKFPREYLADVLDLCKKMRALEEKKVEMMGTTDDPELLARYMAGKFE